jgi:hypothetical protein
MTEARRARHPAAASRRATAGLATALGFGLVAAMAWPPAAADDGTDPTTWTHSPAASQAVDAGAPRLVRVVVRRHHAAPTERVVRVVQAPQAPATTGRTAAVAAAPRAAPRPRTRSGGS